MLIEQIIEFELREPEPPGRYSYNFFFFFMTKQENFEWIIVYC